jgi:hypothetical protein
VHFELRKTPFPPWKKHSCGRDNPITLSIEISSLGKSILPIVIYTFEAGRFIFPAVAVFFTPVKIMLHSIVLF